MAWFPADLIGTISDYFQLSLTGPRLKNNSGNLQIRNSGDTAYAEITADALSLAGTNSGTTKLSVPADAVAELVLPDGLPSTNDVLAAVSVAGSVVTLDWTPVSIASNQVLAQEEVVAYNASSPVAIFTPPANARILTVSVEVEATFDGAGANMSVGVAGSTSRYMGTTEIDLTIAAIFEKRVNYEEDGTPDAIIVTFNPGSGGSQGSARVTITYANPS